MAFLKRLSDNIWSYVSPTKTTTRDALPTPNTAPTFKKPAIPARRASLHNISKYTRSMSPGERVGSWRIRSPSSQASSAVAGGKRKRPFTPSSSAGRKSKSRRFDSMEMQSRDEEEFDDDVSMDDGMDDGYEEDSDIQSPISRLNLRSSSTGLGDEDDDDAVSTHKTVVASEDYEPSRRVVNLPEMLDMGNVATDELRLKGWDDDYITLIQKIFTRGYEPLLPAYLQFEYSFMPDGLFEDGDDAFIASTRGEHFKAGKALEQLLELGGRVRDRIYMAGRTQPEDQVKRQLDAFMKWAFDDAGIDNRSAIPILAMEIQPTGTDAPMLRANALRKCRRLAARYREALKVRRSVEFSPGSRSSNGTLLSYPLPTFYAIIASHAIVALMAYRPDSEESELAAMAYFDFKDKNLDVWNSLALAIVVCHVRNVQMRIAEETGLGLRQQGYSEGEVEESDPDA